MIRAFSTASSGLVAQTNKQDMIANNIANANTPGFKRMKAVTASFSAELQNQLATVARRDRPPYPNSNVASQLVTFSSALDSAQGPITPTGLKTDIAIGGPGSFEVNLNGRTMNTRAGNFQVSPQGDLCTPEGAVVMGESGPIRVPAEDWQVGPDGTITDKDGSMINKIKIVGAQPETTIQQGHIEQANVTIVREMVDMIANMRSYEANQKVIASVDGSLEQLISQVGKV